MLTRQVNSGTPDSPHASTDRTPTGEVSEKEPAQELYPEPSASSSPGHDSRLSRLLRRIWTPPPVPSERRPAGQYGATFIGRIFFTWPTRIVWASLTRDLELLDIEQIDPRRRVSVKREIFLSTFRDLTERKARAALVRTIFACYRREIIMCLVTSGAWMVLLTSVSLLVWVLGMYFQDSYDNKPGKDQSFGRGALLTLALAVGQEIAMLFCNYGMYLGEVVAGEVRTLLSVLMYEKSLRISPDALRPELSREPAGSKPDAELDELVALGQETDSAGKDEGNYWTEGAVLSSMLVDTKRIENAMSAIPSCWPLVPAAPPLVVYSWIILDWPGVLGAVLIILCFPIIGWVANIIDKRRSSINKLTDVRSSLVVDMFRGVRFLK